MCAFCIDSREFSFLSFFGEGMRSPEGLRGLSEAQRLLSRPCFVFMQGTCLPLGFCALRPLWVFLAVFVQHRWCIGTQR